LIPSYLPESLRQVIALPEGVTMADSSETALAVIKVSALTGDGNSGTEESTLDPQGGALAEWVYAVVVPFPTIRDGISLEQVRLRWKGEASSEGVFLVDPNTLEVFSALWGAPGDGAVQVLPAIALVDASWQVQNSIALVPFDELDPRWKVLEVDGVSPLWKEFDPGLYPLTVQFAVEGDPALAESIRMATSLVVPLPVRNRDPEKLTTVILTGVTALVRATAETMRRNGITYPAKDVGPIMRQADIAHVSNEIPFAKTCPQPDPWQTTLTFCSRPEYIELLEEIGTDIVELTGDHFADWGPDAMRYTLDLYDERGWAYYGGGRNVDDGRKAYLVEHNGNKIAFIGCNAKGGGYATASQTNPGAVKCNWEWMQGEIARLKAEGYNVITTFQHFEYYTYKAQPNQEKDSRLMADAGAVIVSGSQAHQPQGFEFYNDALIHYGLGNLFFDQYHMGLPTGQGFLDRHVFYDGRHISTELIGIRFVDFARPRIMTPEEREELLRAVFQASGW